jgi:phage baseplate assembly protein W
VFELTGYPMTFPFRLDPNGHAVVLEQHTEAEVANCVELILACDVGSLVDQPDFGTTDPTFSVSPNLQLLEHPIASWEPRATLDLTNNLDPSDCSIQDVLIEVREQTR